MSPTEKKLRQIAHDIASLSPSELSAFRRWFLAYDAEQWDRAFEDDAAAGRLDGLAEEALNDERAGRTKPL